MACIAALWLVAAISLPLSAQTSQGTRSAQTQGKMSAQIHGKMAAPTQGKMAAQIQGNTRAQKLVDDTVAKHQDVVVLAMHVTPPHSSKNVIIASNIGRIGKEADEDDLRVINTGKPNLEVNKTADRFEVELVLQDVSGKTIGALGVVFPYKAGDNKSEFQKRAERIRDDLRKQIPTLASLFEPR